MQLQHHLSQVQSQIGAAAALGDDRAREIAGALATAAEPAVRLALLDAVGEAAAEITAALLDYPGSPSISVRLDGDDIAVDVHAGQPSDDQTPRHDDGEPNARISLRLTDSLKAEIDAAAEADGVSVNTWLVRAASAALRPGPFATGPGGPGGGFGAGPGSGGRGGRRRDNQYRVTGWING